MVVSSSRTPGFSPDPKVIMAWLAFVLSLLAILLLILARSWRWKLGGLALQYLGLFWLVRPNWALNVAAVTLLSGWMATLVLAITLNSMPTRPREDEAWSEGRIFRSLMALFIVLISFAPVSRITSWLAIGWPVAWSSLLLGGTGLLLLGLSHRALETILGLLTLLTGFEALYASLETSILVAALLTLVHLGMALAAAYLFSLSPEEARS